MNLTYSVCFKVIQSKLIANLLSLASASLFLLFCWLIFGRCLFSRLDLLLGLFLIFHSWFLLDNHIVLSRFRLLLLHDDRISSHWLNAQFSITTCLTKPSRSHR